MRTADVIVAGAGPSGLRVAARLAAAGLEVRVLERKARVGEAVVCTGIVGREVFGAFGLDRGAVVGEMQTVRLVSPRETEFVYTHPRPFACIVDRERFDGGLAEAAAAAGAVVVCGARVEGAAAGPGGVEVAVRHRDGGLERERAKLLVLATGVDFALQKRLGLSAPADFLMGAQVECAHPGAATAALYFGREVAPGAFAWSVPAGPGRARVGLLTRKDPKARLRAFVDRSLGGPSVREEGPVRVRPVAQGLLPRTCGDRVLAVGEAAGQTKTTTGGGISYGLACADLAAGTALDCFRRAAFGPADLAAYERRWKELLSREILVGQLTRRMCARLSDGRIESLFELARTDGLVPIIRATADFDRHSDLIFALLRRLSFMSFFRDVRDRLGPFCAS
ncbi:MAG TPA: NAD(P)/FAD-dependent oxidoreductase [Candidatus Aminicenantes bacterium]|nr:NAD(P)/FAD-dependent oxidoreductase [Candidatus Aminicenantes bacterium]